MEKSKEQTLQLHSLSWFKTFHNLKWEIPSEVVCYALLQTYLYFLLRYILQISMMGWTVIIASNFQSIIKKSVYHPVRILIKFSEHIKKCYKYLWLGHGVSSSKKYITIYIARAVCDDSSVTICFFSLSNIASL